ncbi:MAG: hypothetical protein ACYTGQ_04555 [Planctomycetota bacterium]|jgi:hypothetical protein
MPKSFNANKAICKWTSKQIEQHLDQLVNIVREPRYFCPKCGRVARMKKHLCKSHKLPG